jgi:Transcription factor WhiB
MTTTTTRLRAREASETLTRALVTIGSQGLRTPCSDIAYRDYWVSEREPHRRQAAKWCVEWECPVLAECLAFAIAHDERWCVLGGRDFGKRSKPDMAA